MDTPFRLDDTVEASLQDLQTVTSSGQSVAPVIAGVKTYAPTNHVDHRGRLFEVYPGQNEFWHEPVVYCYSWSIRSRTAKGWGLHLKKDDRYTLIHGEALSVLYDARLDSPTHGLVQEVPLSAHGTRQLLIPKGVWHITLNLTETETFLINHPTQVYDHAHPDRLLLAWDSLAIPFDLASLFPIQLTSCGNGDCH